MAMSASAVSVSNGSLLKKVDFQSSKIHTFGRPARVAFGEKLSRSRPSLSVCAEYNDGSRGGGDFVAGFLIGGAIFGTLAYVFAPQIRRTILNEDESGFRRAQRPVYYDEGLEKTRQTLNAKISQLNSAIDNVSSRLRGVRKEPVEQIETDSEMEAAI
ncbi:hypothetical protein H6P81_005043 [Aristolochia fimbriata]|uniref:Uncharacterized protein n=1 Tax=Aristolochia fimbriata TaxID=158543 RepID=A0AAV7EUS4_ARIFI|nr:hypothetical protein H6P81_005043 [Aristolochia fimbriata]